MLTKGTAHQDKEQVLNDPDPWAEQHFLGNACADTLADWGADIASITKTKYAGELGELRTKACHVLRRALAIHAMALDARGERAEKWPRRPARRPQFSLEEAIKESGHDLKQGAVHWQCTRCKATTTASQLRGWLAKQKCPGLLKLSNHAKIPM